MVENNLYSNLLTLVTNFIQKTICKRLVQITTVIGVSLQDDDVPKCILDP